MSQAKQGTTALPSPSLSRSKGLYVPATPPCPALDIPLTAFLTATFAGSGP